MTRAPTFPLRPASALLAAALALGSALPLAAQQAPGGFTLPQPTPTPTPAPEGPVDERAGVTIPPRAVSTPEPDLPAPRITPAPTLELPPRAAPAASPSPTSTPRTTAQPAPRPSASPPPRPNPGMTPSPAPVAAPGEPAPAETALPAGEAQPGFSSLDQPTPVLPERASAPSEALGAPVLDWRWLVAAGLLLTVLLSGLALWRRRRPRVLRLAAPVEAERPVPELPRIDMALAITGGTRSLRMLTLTYHLDLANRTERAVNDLAVAVQLTSAQRGQSNAAPLAAARSLARVERIGPNQSRSVSGEVQMPLAAITPILQGRTPLFVPLLHITLEGEGQQALTRSFVVGTPGTGAQGRVQPLPLEQPPGSLPELRARAIAAPAH